MPAYAKAKTLTEKAAWDFHAGLSEAERFDLVTILPGFLIGPMLRTQTSVSVDFCRALMMGEQPTVFRKKWKPVVDVREVAFAHLQAIKVKKARNRRFFCVNKTVSF